MTMGPFAADKPTEKPPYTVISVPYRTEGCTEPEGENDAAYWFVVESESLAGGKEYPTREEAFKACRELNQEGKPK